MIIVGANSAPGLVATLLVGNVKMADLLVAEFRESGYCVYRRKSLFYKVLSLAGGYRSRAGSVENTTAHRYKCCCGHGR